MGELERMLSQRHQIATDTWCGRCGYNLRTLSVFGRCPECGSDYDARATIQKGILRDEDIQFPWSGIFGALLSGAFGFGGAYGAAKTGTGWAWFPASAFILLFFLFGYFSYRHAARFIRHKLLLRSALRDHDG